MKKLFVFIGLLLILQCAKAGFIGPSGVLGLTSLSNAAVIEICKAVHQAADNNEISNGRTAFKIFYPRIYATQLYNDVIYFIKVQVDESANSFIHIRVRVPLLTFFNRDQPRIPTLEAVDTNHTLEDPLVYMSAQLSLIGGIINVQNGVISNDAGLSIDTNQPEYHLDTHKYIDTTINTHIGKTVKNFDYHSPREFKY